METDPTAQTATSPRNIDNSIDEDNYFIGTGDVFQISVPDMPSLSYRAQVNQNCDIHVSHFGVLKIGKSSLTEAKQALREFIQPKIRGGGDVYVTLVRGKTATVAVSGSVLNPGTYTLSGMHRILDAIRNANNGKLPDQSMHDYRAVIIRNRSVCDTVDLFAYMYSSVDTANPYLYPGDHILLKGASRTAHLAGAVHLPFRGPIPLRQGETLYEFLSLFPLLESADSSSIKILTGQTRAERIRATYSIPESRHVIVHDNDLITVLPKKDYSKAIYVHVEGEVMSPTPIPIVEGKTTAREAIRLCGGPTPDGDLSRAVVIRDSKTIANSLKDSPLAETSVASADFDLSVVRPEIGAAFHKLNLINDYAVISLNEDSSECPLVEGDHVIVPRREHFVYVSGNVGTPGAYPYVEGESCRHYIREAGGYTSKADRGNTFVLAPYAGAVVMKTNRDVQPGDVIVVPDVQQTKFLRTLFLPVLQAVATTLAAVVALISIIGE